MVYLVINGHDYSADIDTKNYEVNGEAVETSWTDANYTVHKDIHGYRVKGKVKIGFSDSSRLAQFLSDLEPNSEGYYEDISVYVSNMDELVTTDAHIKVTGSIVRNNEETRLWTEYSLDIEARGVINA